LPTIGIDRGIWLMLLEGLTNVAMGGGNEIEISNLSFMLELRWLS